MCYRIIQSKPRLVEEHTASRYVKWKLTVPSTRSTPESSIIFPCTASIYKNKVQVFELVLIVTQTQYFPPRRNGNAWWGTGLHIMYKLQEEAKRSLNFHSFKTNCPNSMTVKYHFSLVHKRHSCMVVIVLTLATVSPIGHKRCGDRVANTPILPPFSLGTLTYPFSQPFK